ncbi:hypothetical protein EJ04DRAFT_548976 [Polyplosphaeria fusca]|uniref:Uncharacterized protein n=1 Tax=Polyplosphaeria fusca TaxID=682080 RepID=A0A9P4RA31_9PLEO|nr:hypothetical protein EJ04DRAFT_548976 [Polyplosphaeria fusca]
MASRDWVEVSATERSQGRDSLCKALDRANHSLEVNWGLCLRPDAEERILKEDEVKRGASTREVYIYTKAFNSYSETQRSYKVELNAEINKILGYSEAKDLDAMCAYFEDELFKEPPKPIPEETRDRFRRDLDEHFQALDTSLKERDVSRRHQQYYLDQGQIDAAVFAYEAEAFGRNKKYNEYKLMMNTTSNILYKMEEDMVDGEWIEFIEVNLMTALQRNTVTATDPSPSVNPVLDTDVLMGEEAIPTDRNISQDRGSAQNSNFIPGLSIPRPSIPGLGLFQTLQQTSTPAASLTQPAQKPLSHIVSKDSEVEMTDTQELPVQDESPSSVHIKSVPYQDFEMPNSQQSSTQNHREDTEMLDMNHSLAPSYGSASIFQGPLGNDIAHQSTIFGEAQKPENHTYSSDLQSPNSATAVSAPNWPASQLLLPPYGPIDFSSFTTSDVPTSQSLPNGSLDFSSFTTPNEPPSQPLPNGPIDLSFTTPNVSTPQLPSPTGPVDSSFFNNFDSHEFDFSVPASYGQDETPHSAPTQRPKSSRPLQEEGLFTLDKHMKFSVDIGVPGRTEPISFPPSSTSRGNVSQPVFNATTLTAQIEAAKHLQNVIDKLKQQTAPQPEADTTAPTPAKPEALEQPSPIKEAEETEKEHPAPTNASSPVPPPPPTVEQAPLPAAQPAPAPVRLRTPSPPVSNATTTVPPPPELEQAPLPAAQPAPAAAAPPTAPPSTEGLSTAQFDMLMGAIAGLTTAVQGFETRLNGLEEEVAELRASEASAALQARLSELESGQEELAGNVRKVLGPVGGRVEEGGKKLTGGVGNVPRVVGGRVEKGESKEEEATPVRKRAPATPTAGTFFVPPKILVVPPPPPPPPPPAPITEWLFITDEGELKFLPSAPRHITPVNAPRFEQDFVAILTSSGVDPALVPRLSSTLVSAISNAHSCRILLAALPLHLHVPELSDVYNALLARINDLVHGTEWAAPDPNFIVTAMALAADYRALHAVLEKRGAVVKVADDCNALSSQAQRFHKNSTPQHRRLYGKMMAEEVELAREIAHRTMRKIEEGARAHVEVVKGLRRVGIRSSQLVEGLEELVKRETAELNWKYREVAKEAQRAGLMTKETFHKFGSVIDICCLKSRYTPKGETSDTPQSTDFVGRAMGPPHGPADDESYVSRTENTLQ